jgi:DNA polymerase III epsilon subunit-like protein
MSNILFIDTETTGLPETIGFDKYYDPVETKYYDKSRLLELAYIICNEKQEIIKKKEFIITPDNFLVSNSHFHGITDEIIADKGQNICDVFDEFEKDLQEVDLIVAHNMLFDMNIVASECCRYSKVNLLKILQTKLRYNCTMKIGRKKFNLKKSPKLVELYENLFNKKIEQRHRALSDAEICKDCYFKMKPS